MPLRYAGMLHVIRYASAGMLLLVFGVNSLYMYRYRYRYRSRDRYRQRHTVVVGARRTKTNTATHTKPNTRYLSFKQISTHVSRYASSRMLVLVFGASALYMYRYGY